MEENGFFVSYPHYYNYRFVVDITNMLRIQHLAKSMDIRTTASFLGEPIKRVSMSLAQTEKSLGAKLFERGEDRKKLIGITKAGKIYIEYANAILEARKKFDSGISHINVMGGNEICPNYMPITCNIIPVAVAISCPYCGAPLKTDDEVCEYCQSPVVIK